LELKISKEKRLVMGNLREMMHFGARHPKTYTWIFCAVLEFMCSHVPENSIQKKINKLQKQENSALFIMAALAVSDFVLGRSFD